MGKIQSRRPYFRANNNNIAIKTLTNEIESQVNQRGAVAEINKRLTSFGKNTHSVNNKSASLFANLRQAKE